MGNLEITQPKVTTRNMYSLLKLGKVKEKLWVLTKLGDRGSAELRTLRRDNFLSAAIFLKYPMRQKEMTQETDEEIWGQKIGDL